MSNDWSRVLEATPLIRRLSASAATLIAAIAAALLATPALAQNATPEDTVDRFHAALAAGDSTLALGFLSPDVVIFESGGAEMSRAEYRSQHLGADIEFSMSTTNEITERRTEAGADVTVVLTRSAARGTFRGHDIDSTGVETMILTRNDEGWTIVHIHWSSR
jgi:ketosteroid isomerase-like protein